jgi:hypothetical protein
MIGTVHERVVEVVCTPQATVPDEDLRAHVDPDDAPIGEYTATLQVLDLTTAPVNAELRAGLGGDGTVVLRHVLSVVLRVEDATVEDARARRDGIVKGLVRRAYGVDWSELDVGDDERVSTASLTIEYPELESDQVQVFAVVTFTVDVEWDL